MRFSTRLPSNFCCEIIETTLKWWITNSVEKIINLYENNYLSLIVDNFSKLDKHYRHGRVSFLFIYFSLNLKFYFIFKPFMNLAKS